MHTNATIDISQIQPLLLVVMGVSGCGKSKLAQGLHQQLQWPFQEGDSLHPQQNIQKMSDGIPLTDEDRIPWLEKCHDWLKECETTGSGRGILTCSSLKRSYRDILRKGLNKPCCFVYLDVPHDILVKRMETRTGHFMPASLLSSQLATLEPPQSDELFVQIHEADNSIEEVIQNTLLALKNIS